MTLSNVLIDRNDRFLKEVVVIHLVADPKKVISFLKVTVPVDVDDEFVMVDDCIVDVEMLLS